MIQLADVVREYPDAVFVRRTDAVSFVDREKFREAGYAMAGALLAGVDGQADERTFVLKPNVVAGSNPNKDPEVSDRGIVTDPDFMAGIIQRLRELGARKIVVAEGGGNTPMGPTFAERGYVRMTEECGVDLLDLNRAPGTYTEEELNWVAVDGEIFKEIPFVRPINDPDVVLINVPTMKTHNLGIISLCGKALQGTIAMGYKHFCSPVTAALKRPDGAREHYQPDVLERLGEHYQRHLKEGYPLWDKEGDKYEGYAQRTCDAVQGINGFLCIVEGVIGRDGTAFNHGKDVLANLTFGGTNPVHVDAVTAYLMGHDPRNIGFLKVAHERGLGRIDPEQIPIFLLGEEGATRCHHADEIGRLALGVYFRGDHSKYVFF